MSDEIRIAFTVRLPDDAEQSAAHCQAIFAAWRAFTESVKATHPTMNEFFLGPAKPVRRRRGRPRLAVTEPPAAA